MWRRKKKRREGRQGVADCDGGHIVCPLGGVRPLVAVVLYAIRNETAPNRFQCAPI